MAPGPTDRPSARRLTATDPALAPVSDLEHACGLLRAFDAPDTEQEATRARMLAFATEHPDALVRTCLAGHLTASALILDAAGERALMTHHRKLGCWLQLGGHCDGDGNLFGVALREAIEESGIEDLVVDPQPIDLDIHTIPARRSEPEHLHLDTRFLIYAPPGAELRVSEESLALAWVSPDEVRELDTDESVLRLFRIAFGGI